MSDGRRPGGLTALAVLNFVFGGFSALIMLLVVGYLGTTDRASLEPEVRANLPSSDGLLWLHLILMLATVTLMLVSGVGYLKQKRFLGRTMGNVYGVTDLAQVAVGLQYAPFGMLTLVSIVYPLLTLFLINTTFRDDLVN